MRRLGRRFKKANRSCISILQGEADAEDMPKQRNCAEVRFPLATLLLNFYLTNKITKVIYWLCFLFITFMSFMMRLYLFPLWLYTARLKIQSQDIHRKAVAIFLIWIRTLRGFRYPGIGSLSEYEPILKIFAIYVEFSTVQSISFLRQVYFE